MTVEQEIQRYTELKSEYDRKIAELEERIEEAEAKLKEDMQAELQHIYQQRRLAEEHLTELSIKQAEAWEDDNFQTGLISVFDEIGQRIERLFSRL